jgi:signal transduction histidine kinase
MSPSADAFRSTTRQATDATEYLRFHTARGYYLKRNAVGLCLVFIWVTSLAGIYSFDLWLLTPILLGAVGAWAALRRQYARFRDRAHYFLAVAVVDNLFITAAVYALGGAGSAGVQTFYTYPIFYHSLTRRRRQIYLVANMAATMYTAMIALECLGVLPYRNVLGFTQPPPLTYVGLALGVFLMLNLAALAGDGVMQAYAKLWNIKEELEQSERKLRKLSAETEFIASAISHELKNPLAAAANAADLLIAEVNAGRPEDVRELGGIVHHNVTKAYDMLTDLRQLLIAVNKEEPSQEVSLRELVDGVLRDLARGGKLDPTEVCVPGGLPSVVGQPKRVAQVFRNLILNALEHGRAGAAPKVQLECVGSDSVPGFIRFAVSDQGPGIPLEHRERIFEPFVTLGEHVSEGRGLGLALAKRVVEDTGGRIWVEDADTGGARFVFTLPKAA